MATVFWKGKQWVAQWYRADGSRVKRSTGLGLGKRREAERSAAEMEAKDRKEKSSSGRAFEEIIARAGADAKAGKLSTDRATEYLTELRRVTQPTFRIVTLAQHLESWCVEKAAKVKPKTHGNYLDMMRLFKAHLKSPIPNSPLTDLTREHLESAMRKMKTSGLKGATINLHLRALRQALNQALEDGIVSRNVAAGISPMPEDDSTERGPFEAEEVRRMVAHEKTSDEWRGAILFGGNTALRLGDIVILGDKYVENGELVIRPKKTERKRKVVRVPLSPALLAWIEGRKGPYFPTLSKISIPTLSMQFGAIMKRCEIPKTVTLPGEIEVSRSFHSLRHSFTSWLSEADIPADVRQKLTGHSSAKQHARYTHHDETLKRAIAALPDLGSGSSSGDPSDNG